MPLLASKRRAIPGSNTPSTRTNNDKTPSWEAVGRIEARKACNGVRLDEPAPVHAILGACTIAPFDNCGGHINPHAGYHYHAVTDLLLKDTAATPHGAEIGLAMDSQEVCSASKRPPRP